MPDSNEPEDRSIMESLRRLVFGQSAPSTTTTRFEDLSAIYSEDELLRYQQNYLATMQQARRPLLLQQQQQQEQQWQLQQQMDRRGVLVEWPMVHGLAAPLPQESPAQPTITAIEESPFMPESIHTYDLIIRAAPAVLSEISVILHGPNQRTVSLKLFLSCVDVEQTRMSCQYVVDPTSTVIDLFSELNLSVMTLFGFSTIDQILVCARSDARARVEQHWNATLRETLILDNVYDAVVSPAVAGIADFEMEAERYFALPEAVRSKMMGP